MKFTDRDAEIVTEDTVSDSISEDLDDRFQQVEDMLDNKRMEVK